MTFEYYYRSNVKKDGYAPGCRKCAFEKHSEYQKTQGYKEYKTRSRLKEKENPNGYINSDKYRKNRSRREKIRSREDIVFAIKRRMRSRMFAALRHGKGGQTWQSLVGYSVLDLKMHIEKRFEKGMTWKRFLNGEIHIDHKIPVSAFNFTSENDIDFKRCWAISNLQPLWAEDNMSKHDKILYPFQPSLGLSVSMRM
jgi:hypothetical protein